MNFDQLYKNVFIAEQEDEKPSSEVPMPEDFDDVEPAPVPEISAEETLSADSEEPGVSVQSSSNLQTYIQELESFANKLNDPDGNSLQTLVANLDKPGTPFEGLSSRTKAEIVRAAEIMRTISEQLKSFIINAAKA